MTCRRRASSSIRYKYPQICVYIWFRMHRCFLWTMHHELVPTQNQPYTFYVVNLYTCTPRISPRWLVPFTWFSVTFAKETSSWRELQLTWNGPMTVNKVSADPIRVCLCVCSCVYVSVRTCVLARVCVCVYMNLKPPEHKDIRITYIPQLTPIRALSLNLYISLEDKDGDGVLGDLLWAGLWGYASLYAEAMCVDITRTCTFALCAGTPKWSLELCNQLGSGRYIR